MMRQRTVYEVYRNGREPLQIHLQAALATFHRRHCRLPAEVVVAAPEMEETRSALAALELPNLPVVTTGGTLVGEVWLALPPVVEVGEDG